MTVVTTDAHFADVEDDPANFHKSIKRLAALPIEALLFTLLADRRQDMKTQDDFLSVQTCTDHFAENFELSSHSRAK